MKVIAKLTGLISLYPGLLTFLFFGVAAAEVLSEKSAQDIVAIVENHYRLVNNITAKVVQNNFLRSIGKTQKFEGRLWIKKPGKLRLDYTNGQTILIDGNDALFYSKKSEQVIKKSFIDFQHMNIPVAFLLGAANIRDDFDVSQLDSKTPRLMELLPKLSGAAMKKLRVMTDENGRITSLTIFDKAGNVTDIAFHDIQEGDKIDEQVFALKPPKGTEVIEQ